MTIYHRLKVWAIKGWRFLKFGFRKTRARTGNMVFLEAVERKCDYCGVMRPCVILEADYEVYLSICEDNLRQALLVFGAAAPQNLPTYKPDHRGVITG